MFHNELYKILLFILVVVSNASCHSFQDTNSKQSDSVLSIQKGKELASQYCRSCHSLPDPAMLSSDKWVHGVLPQMGPRLGIFAYGFQLYPSRKGDPEIGDSFYPSQPVLSYPDWQHIIDYYTSQSPDTLLSAVKEKPVISDDTLFTSVISSFFSYPTPVAGSVYIDTGGRESHLLLADIVKQTVVSTDKNTRPVDSVHYSSGVVCMALSQDTLTTANIGILNPNDKQTGTIQQVIYRNGKFLTKPVVLDSGLRRPVHIDVTDLNDDGRKDILVCEFGNLKGALSWLENKGDNYYERHTIRNVPGAIATVIKDFNGDGLPDFYVLFAQGDEQIIRFENKGGGQFAQKQLLHFQPEYGSSYFEMDDINKDGFDDIIYTCGDNADYSIELKPYHGMYIFINDGQDHFKQQYFYHINGCFKAMARDFDGDGDADIAALSFFADYKDHPEEGFVYLKNNGNYQFTPYSLPAAKNGRWICMDAGDADRDGRPDVVLGNFSYPSFIPSTVDWKHKPAFLLLKNNTF